MQEFIINYQKHICCVLHSVNCALLINSTKTDLKAESFKSFLEMDLFNSVQISDHISFDNKN